MIKWLACPGEQFMSMAETKTGFRCQVGDLFRAPTTTGRDAAEKA
jgi:hypothetical protein